MGIATVHYLSMNVRNGKFAASGTVTSGVNATFTATSLNPTTDYSVAWGDTKTSNVGPFTVTNKALTTNVATLTSPSHTFIVGDTVTVSGVDATFNGTYVITAVAGSGASKTFSYAKTATDVTSAAVSPAGSVKAPASNSSGTLTRTHTYSPAGTYTASVIDNVTGQVVAKAVITVV